MFTFLTNLSYFNLHNCKDVLTLMTLMAQKELKLQLITIITSKNSFKNTIRVPNSLDPDQVKSVLIRFHTVCKGYRQMTKIAAGNEMVLLNQRLSHCQPLPKPTHLQHSPTYEILRNVIPLRMRPDSS